MVKYIGMKKNLPEQHQLLKRIGLIFLAIIVFYSGFGLGLASRGSSASYSGNWENLSQAGSSKRTVDFDLFWDIWDTLQETHINSPIAEDDLIRGAISGLVDAAGDPYTQYFDPEMAELFNQDLSGSFYGIGAEIGLRDELITVIAPLAGSPAESAGLRAGDKILAVDGQETYDWTVTEAVQNIRGEKGAEVVLTVLTPGEQAERDITIERDEITIDSVTYEIDDNIAIIEISQFNEDTYSLFNQAVQEILASEVDGIVLDLRNNPGGLLDQAIGIADFWIDDKLVVTEAFRERQIPMSSRPGARLEGIKTAVLVNGGSASGSEIVAGALKDYDLARIIGEQTFGKGSVQNYQSLKDGSAIKITIAKWLTPSGSSINEIGIEPDEIVELTLEDFNDGKDPQLEAALDYLKTAQ